MKISDDSRLLDFFFNPRCSDDNDEYKNQKPFLVFNLLVGYIFGFDDISHQARDALLLILTASRKLDFVAKHVAYVVYLTYPTLTGFIFRATFVRCCLLGFLHVFRSCLVMFARLYELEKTISTKYI
jgi:hypothetical protein